MVHSPHVIWLAFVVAACAPTGTAGGGAAARSASSRTGDFEAASRSLAAVADDYWTDLIQTYPLWGVFLGVPEASNDRLGDNSLAATRAWERKEDRWLAQLGAIDPTPLRGHAEEATYGILRETLEAARQTRVCHAEYWPLNQQNGLQISLPLLSELQPVGTAELRSTALARWRAMPRFIDTEIESLRRDCAGATPCRRPMRHRSSSSWMRCSSLLRPSLRSPASLGGTQPPGSGTRWCRSSPRT